jgi:hypothetical protein
VRNEANLARRRNSGRRNVRNEPNSVGANARNEPNSAGANAQNEPNLPIADWGLGTGLRRNARPAAWRLRPARAGCTNEPNFGGHLAPTTPIFQSPGVNRAKRTQFGARTRPSEGRQGRKPCRRRGKLCETKPISSQPWDGQVLCGKRVMVDWTHTWPWQNKANLPHGGSGPGATSLPRRSSVRNEANLRFCAARSSGATQWRQCGSGAGAIVRNKPNLPQMGTARREQGGTDHAKQSQFACRRAGKTIPKAGGLEAATRHEANVRNEPNFGEGRTGKMRPGSILGNSLNGGDGRRWHELPAHAASAGCGCNGIHRIGEPSAGTTLSTRGL